MMTLEDRAEPGRPRWQTVARIVLVFVLLYVFLGGMRMMGHGLKGLGEDPDFDKAAPVSEKNLPYRDVVYDIFAYADNPLVGLFVGVLATSIFQSSSFTTSFAVSLVVTTPLTLHQAIFIIMGANIGTSVTNVGVSFTHVRRKDEFQRAYGAAIVHDFFNVLSVLLLFPVEWIVWARTGRGLIERLAVYMSSVFYSGATTGQKPTNFIKEAVKPLVNAADWVLTDGLGLGDVSANITMAVLGVAFLLVALILLTTVLKSLVMTRVEQFFDKVLFRNAATAYLVGLILTATVQSSSITTSLAVPLVGAGLLTIYQVYPYTLGANLGTTVTALIASLATSADTVGQAQVGVSLAFGHMLFNLLGAAVWYPLRCVPIRMANWWARLAAGSKRYAVLHLLVFFFILPLLVIVSHWFLG
ncbi:MAG TPA: Na/Pi symporter [Phycisphaerae bacterium]|nr:Na/Pi symporter [Phycisphaerae bacterium]